MPAPMCCPTAALDIILRLASHPPRPEVVCLLLDTNHRGQSSLVVTDAPRDLTALTASLTRVCAELPWVRAVVLAFCSPGGGYLPSALEHIAFLDSREQFDLIGVELLDWFVLDAGRASSLAEATDARALWRPRQRNPYVLLIPRRCAGVMRRPDARSSTTTSRLVTTTAPARIAISRTPTWRS